MDSQQDFIFVALPRGAFPVAVTRQYRHLGTIATDTLSLSPEIATKKAQMLAKIRPLRRSVFPMCWCPQLSGQSLWIVMQLLCLSTTAVPGANFGQKRRLASMEQSLPLIGFARTLTNQVLPSGHQACISLLPPDGLLRRPCSLHVAPVLLAGSSARPLLC